MKYLKRILNALYEMFSFDNIMKGIDIAIAVLLTVFIFRIIYKLIALAL